MYPVFLVEAQKSPRFGGWFASVEKHSPSGWHPMGLSSVLADRAVVRGRELRPVGGTTKRTQRPGG